MASLNELAWQAFSSNSGTTGSLNEVTYAYLSQVSGETGLTLNGQWLAALAAQGYTTGSINERQMAYWGDQGYTGNWNSRYYQWLSDGGNFGPSVRIDTVSGGSCTYEPPGTVECAAAGTYEAVISGFTNPAGIFTYLWEKVSGPGIFSSPIDEITVQLDTLDDENTATVLKVTVTEAGASEQAERESTVIQTHTDTNVAPVFIGPNIASTTLTEGVPVGPVDISSRWTGTNLVFTSVGTSVPGVSISTSGVISGTPTTDGVYSSRSYRATNSKGTADSNLFTTTVIPAQAASLAITQQVQGSCNWQDPATSCSASNGRYLATPTGFTPDTWVWSILSGPGSISGGQNTSLVAVSQDASSNEQITLQCVASEGGTAAQNFAQFTINHTNTTVAPVYVGPTPPADFALTQGVPFSFDASIWFTGYVGSYMLDGPWPPGLSINSAGLISGTPTTVGTYGGLAVHAFNSAGQALSWQFDGDVVAAPVAPLWTGTIPDQNWANGTPVNLDTKTWLNTPTLPLTFAIQTASLPTGVTLNTSTGVISGTPSADSNATFTVRCQNGVGADDSNVVTWTVTSGPALPAFWALTPDETTYEMLGVREGTGGLTTTHTASLYAPDFDGVYRLFGANRPVWSGGRVVTNGVPVSNDVTTWEKSTVSVVTGKADPIGGLTATEITATADTGYCRGINVVVGPGWPTQTIWVRRVTGTGAIYLYNADTNARYKDISSVLTTQWKRFSATDISELSSSKTNLRYGIRFETSGDAVEIYGSQVESFPTENGNNASEYIPTAGAPVTKVFGNENGNTVLNSVVTEAVGAPLPEVPWLQYFPAATNSAIYSRDFTNAAWAKTTMTAEYTQVGLTGEPNTASLLTATGANATAIQTVTATSGQHAAKFYLKRSVGTGAVEITVDNVTWTPVTLTTDFQLFEVDATVTNPQIGVRIVTSGDAVICGNVEGFLTSTAAQIRGLGPVITTTASVAVDKTVYNFDIANHSDNGAWYIEAKFSVDVSTVRAGIYSVGSTSSDGVAQDTSSKRIRYRPASSAGTLTIDETGTFIDTPIPIGFVTSLTEPDMGIRLQNVTWVEGGSTYVGWTTSISITIGLSASEATEYRELQRWNITSYIDGKNIIDGLMQP